MSSRPATDQSESLSQNNNETQTTREIRNLVGEGLERICDLEEGKLHKMLYSGHGMAVDPCTHSSHSYLYKPKPIHSPSEVRERLMRSPLLPEEQPRVGCSW